MVPRRTVNDPNNKPSQYRLPFFVGVAGVILLALGFIIPVQGWNVLLIALGSILLFAAAFSIRLWFIGDWIPTLFAEKERDNKDDLPPPPTADWRF